jgi:pantothenate kinase type III
MELDNLNIDALKDVLGALKDIPIDELKKLAEQKTIPSVNQGIRLAVDNFIAQVKQQEYELAMSKAGADASFLKRTLDMHNAFADSDSEGIDKW